MQPSGGRTWWAHFEFTRINITPTILPKKIEDWREVGARRETTGATATIAQDAARAPSRTAGMQPPFTVPCAGRRADWCAPRAASAARSPARPRRESAARLRRTRAEHVHRLRRDAPRAGG